MSQVVEKFLRYISYDTQSDPSSPSMPSTSKQFELARRLAEELTGMGAAEVMVDDHCYVTATIPATSQNGAPVLGFVAHLDTAPAFSGKGVNPQMIKHYSGGEIVLNEALGISMGPDLFPDLHEYIGQDLIVTDGTTLLGADDKAGVAEIMAMAEHLINHPEIRHGKIRICFTPDEEIGRGADGFDVPAFGADVAYTVDGGGLGELEYENFNAASGIVTIQGSNIHPGSAKGRMKNALLMGMEFQSLLPVFENPMYTEQYEGFFHLDQMQGNVETAVLEYIIRDHDKEKFDAKKELFLRAGEYLNHKYGKGSVTIKLTDSYYNMKEKIEPFLYLIDVAKEAMTGLGISPLVIPIRGGTDGARLSYMGLPCPNLCTGGHNFHGKYEYIPVQSMEKIVLLLVKIAEKIGEINPS